MGSVRQPDAAGPERRSPGRPLSLRFRLMTFALVVLAVALSLVGLALDAAFYRSSESELRSQMETWVYLTLGAAEVTQAGEIRVSDDMGDPRLGQPGSGIYVHVHGREDHWNSPSALGTDLPETELTEPGQMSFDRERETGFYVLRYGVSWELADASIIPFTVSVLADAALLEPKVRAFRRGLWKSLGGAGLILAVAQLAFLSLGLRPLRRIAGDVAAIESGARERLAGAYPRELEPLTRNLDRLLKTEKANRDRYRSALDSLAHSLKTPLAVMRTGLSSRSADLEGLENAIDEMHHLITTRLQRAAASTRRTMAAPVPVKPMAERLLNSLRKVHSHNLKKDDVIIPTGLVFYGEERDLMELMGNLIDNACKYGAGTVRISAGAIEPETMRPGLWVKVENDGRPIAGDQKERLLQRGVRGDERIEGHGLGLTIVMELVTAYGGDITIDESDLGGASFLIRIPPA